MELAKVKIYKIECDQAFMAGETGERFSLHPWGTNTEYYHGCDDGGEDYVLPDGYSLGEDSTGLLSVWDEHDNHCAIVTHASGRPQLVSIKSMPVLREAD